MEQTTLKQRVKDQDFWLRLPFILLFFIGARLAGFIVGVLVLVQLVFKLVQGQPQQQLLKFSAQLVSFNYQALRYITFNTDTKPFPFDSWPATEPADLDPQFDGTEQDTPQPEVTPNPAPAASVVEPIDIEPTEVEAVIDVEAVVVEVQEEVQAETQDKSAALNSTTETEQTTTAQPEHKS